MYMSARAASPSRGDLRRRQAAAKTTPAWLRTNGVNTNGAAANGFNFDRWGTKVRPGTFGKINVG